jgi:hypothetical protein
MRLAALFEVVRARQAGQTRDCTSTHLAWSSVAVSASEMTGLAPQKFENHVQVDTVTGSASNSRRVDLALTAKLVARSSTIATFILCTFILMDVMISVCGVQPTCESNNEHRRRIKADR